MNAKTSGAIIVAIAVTMTMNSVAWAVDSTAGSLNIPILSGGIGRDELDNLTRVQNQYDTKLLFTQNDGEFLADIPVSVQDRHGQTVVNTVAGGPVLLMNLPSGRYKITAVVNGVTQQQTISVSERSLKTYQFRFHAQDTNPT